MTTHATHVLASPDPLAPSASRFALVGASLPDGVDGPSPEGIRPWGLRRARLARAGRALPAWSYDEQRQLAVDPEGRPLLDAGDPTAVTTSSLDGEDGPSSEDWIND